MGMCKLGSVAVMPLDNATKRRYRAIGHKLKPVVMVSGNGLSPSVIAEIDRALNDHELIKVKFAIPDRESRQEAVNGVTAQLKAESIQSIGKMGLFYRASPEPVCKRSNIRNPI